jgi:hypothetical protein
MLSGGAPTLFTVGNVAEPGIGGVVMGNPTPGPSNYKIATIFAHASDIEMRADGTFGTTSLDFQNAVGNTRIITSMGDAIMTSSGSMTITSASGLLSMGGSTGSITTTGVLNTLAGTSTWTAPTSIWTSLSLHETRSANIRAYKSVPPPTPAPTGTEWFIADTSLGSITCSATPLPGPGHAFRLYEDLILVGDSSEIIADNTADTLIVGPFLEICGQFLKGASDILRIGDTLAGLLSIRNTIRNDATVGSSSVTFSDDDGYDFLDGPTPGADTGEVHVETCIGGGTNAAEAALDICGDLVIPTGGKIDFGDGITLSKVGAGVNAKLALNGIKGLNFVGSGTSPYLAGNAVGLLTWNGNDGAPFPSGGIHAVNGVVRGRLAGASGNCVNSGSTACNTIVSDPRAKENVGELTGSLSRILRAQVKHFTYKKELAGVDSTHEQRGFMAPSLKRDFPRMVHIVKKKLGNVTIPDFHTLDLKQMIPDMVGATQTIHKKLESAQAYIKKLHWKIEDQVAHMKKMEDKFEKLQKKLAHLIS